MTDEQTIKHIVHYLTETKERQSCLPYNGEPPMEKQLLTGQAAISLLRLQIMEGSPLVQDLAMKVFADLLYTLSTEAFYLGFRIRCASVMKREQDQDQDQEKGEAQ